MVFGVSVQRVVIVTGIEGRPRIPHPRIPPPTPLHPDATLPFRPCDFYQIDTAPKTVASGEFECCALVKCGGKGCCRDEMT